MTTSGQADDGLDPGLRAVLSERRTLINLGYRLLGSLADAEDVVQETYTRWYGLTERQRGEIDSPGGWLTTVATRICLDILGSARARRERYVGEWIPEPVPTSTEWVSGRSEGQSPDPADRVTLDDSVNMAFLVVLESLTPAERVAFILHDVFRYPFADIAEMVGRSPGACRQLASSARQRIAAANPTPAPRRDNVVRAFKDAWAAMDIDALVGLLDPDVISVSDGGGVVSAHRHPIAGSDRVAHAYAGIARAAGGLRLLERTVNGQPGLVAQIDGVTVTVLAFDIAGGRITHIWAVRNPDKLRAWAFD